MLDAGVFEYAERDTHSEYDYYYSVRWNTRSLGCNEELKMHDEIIHVEKVKYFMKILKYFATPFLKYFMNIFDVHY